MTATQQRALSVATLISIGVIFVILRQFMAAVIAACIAAYILTPIRKSLTRRTHRPRLSMLLTWIIGLIGFVIPFTLIVWLTVDQITQVVDQVNRLVASGEIDLSADAIAERVNLVLAQYSGGKLAVTSPQLQSLGRDFAKFMGNWFVKFGTALVSGFPSFITDLIVFLFALSGLMTGYGEIIALLERINPLGKRATDAYLEKADAMTEAMIKGQFVVAIVQGVVSALFLEIAGVGHFGFFSLLLSFMSLIPLGAGIVTVPIGLVLLATGNVWGGLLLILGHFLVVTNIDNVLRPRLVPHDVGLGPALTMISVLAGVAMFGFFGIVVGPVMLILAITTVQVYADVTSPEDGDAEVESAAQEPVREEAAGPPSG